MITLPDPSTVLASSSSWTVPIFNDFLSWILMGVGVVFGFVLIGIIIAVFKNFFAYTIHHEPINHRNTAYENWKKREASMGYRRYD